MATNRPKPAPTARPGRIWMLGSEAAHAADVEAALEAEGWRVGVRLQSLQHLLLHLHCEAAAPDVLVCGLSFDDGDAFTLMRLLINDPRAPALFLVIESPQRVVLRSALAMAAACKLSVAGCAEQPLTAGQIAQALRPYRLVVPARAQPVAPDPSARQLHAMLEQERLQVRLQPQLQLDSREVVGVAALMQGVLEDGTLLPTEQLVPALKRHSLLEAATLAVARQTCGFLADCLQDGVRLSASIQASMHSLSDAEFCAGLQQLVHDSRLDPARLTIEISESDAAADFPTVIENTARCRMLGFNLSIAEIGTAYSSLLQLSQLPLSELKLARTLVADIDADATRQTIVASYAGLARGLGLRVVADGVETAAELRALQAAGCTEVQGKLLAPSLSVEEMHQWLRGLDGQRLPPDRRRGSGPL